MNRFAKYLLCFFVGFILAQMIGNGFSVGGVESDSSDSDCDKLLNELCHEDRRFSNDKCSDCTNLHNSTIESKNCTNYAKNWCNKVIPRNICPKTILDLQSYTDNYNSFHNLFKKQEDYKDVETKIPNYYDRYNVCVNYNPRKDKIIANANNKDQCQNENSNFQWCVYPSKTFVLTDAHKHVDENKRVTWPIIEKLLSIDHTGNALIPEANFVHISDWDTSQVTSMRLMFNEAEKFKGDISRWDTSQVTDMYSMFYGAEEFNSDISRWDTSQVTNMDSMFYKAESFKSDIGNWDTSQVTDMSFMFNGARQFNIDLGNWNTSKLHNIELMFHNSGLDDKALCLRKWNLGDNLNIPTGWNSIFSFCEFSKNIINYTEVQSLFSNHGSFKTEDVFKEFFNGECDSRYCKCDNN